MSAREKSPSRVGASAKDAAASESGEVIVHEYDGILEADNRLPRWWLGTLWGAVIFAAGYWLYYHTYDRADLPSEEYARIKKVELAAEAERIKAAGEVTDAMLITLSKDDGTVEEGKAIFDKTCVTCHDAGAKGNIGPNLTDGYWLHGGGPKQVYTTVHDGFLAKQMPAWGKPLGEEKTRAVVAYVLTLKDTNVPGGKAPQGEQE